MAESRAQTASVAAGAVLELETLGSLACLPTAENKIQRNLKFTKPKELHCKKPKCIYKVNLGFTGVELFFSASTCLGYS